MDLESTPTSESTRNGISQPLDLAFAPLHKTALGVACGLVCGALVFLATAVLIVTHVRGPLGPNMSLLGQYFLGYTVSWKGGVIGLVWGGVLGFIVGWGFAFLRNITLAFYLLMIKTQAEAEQYRDFLDHV